MAAGKNDVGDVHDVDDVHLADLSLAYWRLTGNLMVSLL